MLHSFIVMSHFPTFPTSSKLSSTVFSTTPGVDQVNLHNRRPAQNIDIKKEDHPDGLLML